MHKLLNTPQNEDDIIFSSLQRVQPDALVDHVADEAVRTPAAAGGPYRLELGKHDVSLKSGFLPEGGNARSLPSGLPESAWEEALSEAKRANLRLCGTTQAIPYKDARAAQRWKERIEALPVIRELSPALLEDKQLLRRAYVVLSFLGHFWMHSMPEPLSAWSLRNTALGKVLQIWSGPWQGHITALTPRAVVPRCIAVPWVRTAELLGMKPVHCYASASLWNYSSAHEGPELQPEAIESFTGNSADDAFHLAAVRVEMAGAETIGILHRTITAHLAETDAQAAARSIARELTQLRGVIQAMSKQLARLPRECDPRRFFWAHRPWTTGTPPQGWLYDLADDGLRRKHHLDSTSTGATALLQTIDAFLGVAHADAQRRFREEAKQYMPAGHRRFVNLVESLTTDRVWTSQLKQQLRYDVNAGPVRGFVLACKETGTPGASDLVQAYNEALDELDAFRREEFKIIALFVLLQSKRKPPPEYHCAAPPNNTPRRSDGTVVPGGGLNELSPLLKGYKSGTVAAKIV